MTGPGAETGAAAQVDQWVAQAKAKAERYQAMRAAADGVSVTVSSKDGMVTVTVDSAGNVADLKITDRVRELSGAQVAAAVLGTIRRAQAKLPERLDEVMAETIGEDKQTREKVVGDYRAKFPEPPPEPDEAAPPAAEGPPVRDIGGLGEESAAESPPAAATPPAPPTPQRTPRRRPDRDDSGEDDDGGFGDSFMVRG